MTRDRARKKAIRARMAASGEPYSVAAAAIAAAGPADDATAVRAIIIRASNTMAAASARIEWRVDWEFTRPGDRPERRPPGLVARLARRGAKAAWQRIAPDTDVASLRDAFAHQGSVGYLEPAADRWYLSGDYAQLRVGGQNYGGLPGSPLTARYRQRATGERPEEPLGYRPGRLRRAHGLD